MNARGIRRSRHHATGRQCQPSPAWPGQAKANSSRPSQAETGSSQEGAHSLRSDELRARQGLRPRVVKRARSCNTSSSDKNRRNDTHLEREFASICISEPSVNWLSSNLNPRSESIQVGGKTAHDCQTLQARELTLLLTLCYRSQWSRPAGGHFHS